MVGNSKGIATPSPILIDIRLDILDIQKKSSVTNNANFVIGRPNSLLPYAQVLSSLRNGLLYNTDGIISSYDAIPINNLTDLPYGMAFVGNNNNRPIILTPPRGPEGPQGYQGPRGDTGIGIKGLAGLLGKVGATGLLGLQGLAGQTGPEGAAGDNGTSTLVVTTNYNMNGNDIDNVSQSPNGDFSGLTARWAWDFINDKVVINF